MIRPDDFGITIGDADGNLFIHVIHIPAGNERRCDAVAAGDVSRIRSALIAELRGLLFVFISQGKWNQLGLRLVFGVMSVPG